MKSFSFQLVFAGFLLLLSPCSTKPHNHNHFSRHAKAHLAHSHFKAIDLSQRDTIDIGVNNNDADNSTHKPLGGLEKETISCEFPSGVGLVPITPKAKNAGWAMLPDEKCSPGSYCPYACPSGQVMAQWNPDAKAYTYPQSMDGGLYCDHDGKVKKPFPAKPYCVSGTGGVGAHNKVGTGVSFCQTVLPGNEAMLIPTHVEDMVELAVPGTNYWCNTAAHYYINPPGIGVEDACIWGDGSKPVGNWSPYVAGANTDESGKTFVKVGWNPIYTGSSLSKVAPNFGVKISCEKGDCNGTPCSIDPSTDGVGGVMSSNKASGAGGANFCVVTVPKGSRANIEVFHASKTQGKDVEPSKPEPSDDIDEKSHPSSATSISPSSTAVQPTKIPTPTESTVSSPGNDSLKPEESLSDSVSTGTKEETALSTQHTEPVSEPDTKIHHSKDHTDAKLETDSIQSSQNLFDDKISPGPLKDSTPSSTPTLSGSEVGTESNIALSQPESEQVTQTSIAGSHVETETGVSSDELSDVAPDRIRQGPQQDKSYDKHSADDISLHSSSKDEATPDAYINQSLETESEGNPIADASTKHAIASHEASLSKSSTAALETIPTLAILSGFLLTCLISLNFP